MLTRQTLVVLFPFLNPADIESIDILKDADATSIYGSRGSHNVGVVLITTKKREGWEKIRVEINAQHGFGEIASGKLDVLNTQQYLEMRHEAFKNDGASINPSIDYDLTHWDQEIAYTDWQQELIGGQSQFYRLASCSIWMGNELAQYRIATGYRIGKQLLLQAILAIKGIFSIFHISGNSPNKKFSIQLSGTYTIDNNRLCAYDLTEQAIRLPPNAPALYKFADGSINWAL